MTIEYMLPLLMLAALILGIFSGYPVAFVLAGVGIIFSFLGDVPILFLSLTISRIYSGILTNWLLIAIPLFVFMGLMLERSGVAERLLRSLSSLFRGFPGGYGFAVAIIGVVMAASTGIIGASVVLMGMMALPTMLANNYNKGLSSGLIAASGTLGILIPPSIMLIVLGDQLRVSVGDLFMAAMGPGILLGALYLLVILLVAIFQPEKMPSERSVSHEPVLSRIKTLVFDLAAPMALIGTVLGTIVAGVATPTESAAIGALGATLFALFGKRLSRKILSETFMQTTKTTAMIVFVMMGATVFSVVFRKLGGDAMIADAFHLDGAGPYYVLGMIMLLVFILGFFMEWVEIVLVVVPIVAPIIAKLNFGIPPEQTLIWFAIALSVNLQSSFLTPPFGYALFYLKGVAPPEVKMTDIYKGVIPFVLIQLMVLLGVLVFPQLALWLPNYLSS
ncbi:TRAP transporter large permease [Marinobacterium mangrovicola]|uniref:TRAP transporter large permease protein n=1 Tax=Marinobacterium mangrovicola TaxID=1476959 RepID=A0A4R1GLZ0_9GAMM|nr:TRAP transporter large permease subunit [Marinobacterium mangrovicola]TCK09318.1 tripartite ATP-independent transporter DctM subunit [Marinobacterium mangrovicola]